MALKLSAVVLICGGLAVSGAPAVPETARAAEHVLNRLGYGSRPGEVSRVLGMGVAAWIEQQLHPERIDDTTLTARLASLTTLSLDTPTIVQDYSRPVIAERLRRRDLTAAGAVAVDSGVVDPADPVGRPAPTAAQAKNRQVMADLEDAKLLRAVYSERQLEAVLTDFWFNHFNVFAGKGQTRNYVTEYERDVIRPRVFGRFRDLLGATAKSPAMLFYLDNWQNADPNAARAWRGRPGRQARPPRGLNENYARELMELHTLGVDGGYTQADIVAVARAFTGWTMKPREGSGFVFVAALHDGGAKTVLGHSLRAGGGIDDGEQVLDLLAAHPATAHLVARKLAQRFVSDTPPAALVDRAAARFLATRGDLREVVRVIVTAPEFFAGEVMHAKLKTPFEFVASALRAAGADVVRARPLARTLRELGMPSYGCQPPTGYDDTAETWAAAGLLVSRVNFAIALTGNQVPGSRVPPEMRAGDRAGAIGAPAFQRR